MAPKPRSRAGMDADAVARMMAQQDEPESEIVSDLPAPASPPPQQEEPAPAFDPGKVDGRTLRRTFREPFATRIKPETVEKLKRVAYTKRITIAEALEAAVAAYDDR